MLSIQATSPERRFTQKEIIAGEERPKYLLIKQHQDAANAAGKFSTKTLRIIILGQSLIPLCDALVLNIQLADWNVKTGRSKSELPECKSI